MTATANTLASARLNSGVLPVRYDRGRLTTRMVHLGFGAFHRAHQALYTHLAAEQGDSEWGECVIRLFSGMDEISALRRQDHLYSVVEKGADSTQARVIGVITEAMHPRLDGVDAVLEKLAEPQVAIVSLTITEKGYCADPASGGLDTGHPLIREDLANPAMPMSAIGYLVQALRLRRERGLAPFTVLSCDNVPDNGRVARQVVLDLAHRLDPGLAWWIESQVSFPCTMVDRIVPAATAASLEEAAGLLGVNDPCSIRCEPFRQWVIEDDFVAGRPAWERAGAELVQDVRPYEDMKLRMLNGSHSLLAYLGYLGGFQHIDETMADPHYRRLARTLMLSEQAPTLTMPAGVDLDAYAGSLLARFANPGLKHGTAQIAMDGSQKLPQRWLQSVRWHLKRGSDFSVLALGIAGWMRYVHGMDEQGRSYEVHDPLAAPLQAICRRHGLQPAVVPELLQVSSIFGTDLASEPRFVAEVTAAYRQLLNLGARATVACTALTGA